MTLEKIFVIVLGLLSLLCGLIEAKFKEGECEVCVKMIQRFTDSMDSDTRSSSQNVEAEFKKFCKTARGKDERLCYYVGGAVDSATYIVRVLADPISWGAPADVVCEKLKKKDPQICELKYDKQIDLSKVNLNKLKVKDLKKILSDWGEDSACKGCAEKSDFIHVIKELLPRYAPEAAKLRDDL